MGDDYIDTKHLINTIQGWMCDRAVSLPLAALFSLNKTAHSISESSPQRRSAFSSTSMTSLFGRGIIENAVAPIHFSFEVLVGHVKQNNGQSAPLHGLQ